MTLRLEAGTDIKRNPPPEHVLDASQGGGTGTLF